MYVETTLTGEAANDKESTKCDWLLIEYQGGDASPVRSAEVSRLLGQVDKEAENTVLLMIPFTVGETVKVINGPFSTFDATIEKINEEKQKLEVTVKIGRKTPVELSFTSGEIIIDIDVRLYIGLFFMLPTRETATIMLNSNNKKWQKRLVK